MEQLEISGMQVQVTWIEHHKHMIVRDPHGGLLYSSMGYRHTRLTPKDIEEFDWYYNKHKRSYVFQEVQ